MHLLITENQKYLIRFQAYSDVSTIEVFGLNPVRQHNTISGRLIGFSRDFSLMLVWNNDYKALDLNRGIVLKAEQLNREDFAPEILLDVRGTDNKTMQLIDVLSGKTLRELSIPEERGVSKSFQAAIKIIGTGYGMMNVWYMYDWGEGYEGHIFELATGKYQMMASVEIDHYQPKQKILYLRPKFAIKLLELDKAETLARLSFSSNEKVLADNDAIASFPTNPFHIAIATGRDIFFVDIVPPENIQEWQHKSRYFDYRIRTKMTAWHPIDALCVEETGRYIYISYKNGEIDVFDMQIKQFSQHYRIPLWKKVFGG